MGLNSNLGSGPGLYLLNTYLIRACRKMPFSPTSGSPKWNAETLKVI